MAEGLEEVVTDKVMQIVAEQTGIESAQLSTGITLKEGGADSLDMAELVIELEDELDIEIPDADAEGLMNGTVASLTSYVLAKVQNKTKV